MIDDLIFIMLANLDHIQLLGSIGGGITPLMLPTLGPRPYSKVLLGPASSKGLVFHGGTLNG